MAAARPPDPFLRGCAYHFKITISREKGLDETSQYEGFKGECE